MEPQAPVALAPHVLSAARTSSSQRSEEANPGARHTLVYYNEFDPYAAAWLRNLIAAGHLPAGDVDERDIRDVIPADLAGYRQCHFFAGIGGWPYGLRLAGVPVDLSLWTGSAPCQPFSSASRGRRHGTKDDRHLWPELRRLLAALRPRWFGGENVADLDHRLALDQVVSDLEAIGYEVAPPLEIPSCAVGRDHWRARLWIVGHADGEGEPGRAVDGEVAGLPRDRGEPRSMVPAHGVSARVAQLRAFGNAVDAAIVAELGRAILAAARRDEATSEAPAATPEAGPRRAREAQT